MVDYNDFSEERECTYKDRKYVVRDNGAIMRLPKEGGRATKFDNLWTFGNKDPKTAYMNYCGERVHIIVATAFYGPQNSKVYVVDHIDTNRYNNRPENLRWLTRLENVLNNPITCQKIISICGSVEAFLENPRILDGRTNGDYNLEWMRTVSKEEAANTLAHWNNWLATGCVHSEKRQPVDEWIYQDVSLKKENIVNSSISENKIIASNKSVTPAVEDKLTIEEKPANLPISKSEFMSSVINVCNCEGWAFVKYHKAANWKTDILININGNRFAFSAYNSLPSASKVLPLINNDSVNGFGFILSPKKSVMGKLPCFGLHRQEDKLIVHVEDSQLSFEEFLKKTIERKIKHLNKVKVSEIDLCFPEVDCYYCGSPYHVFVVRHLIDEFGKKYDYALLNRGNYSDGQEPAKMPDLQFGSEIRQLIHKYLDSHPELGFKLGPIKSRFSRTMNQSYLSFGCPKCDAIFGDHYLNELKIDVLYDNDQSHFHRLKLETPFELPVSQWKVL